MTPEPIRKQKLNQDIFNYLRDNLSIDINVSHEYSYEYSYENKIATIQINLLLLNPETGKTETISYGYTSL